MKKIFIILFLVCIITCTSLFSFFYIFFNLLPPENTINNLFRSHAIKHEVVKNLFKLHQVGDARFLLFSKPLQQIELNIFTQDGVSLELDTLENIKKPILLATHKSHMPIIADDQTLYGVPHSVTDEDINELFNTYRKSKQLFSQTVPLNIFVLNEYAEQPSLAGLVVDDHSIILFKKMIDLVSDHQQSSSDAEVSTILHEFAHLSGAEHITTDDCILLEKIENIDLFNRPSHFRNSYCIEDIQEIQKHLDP